MITIKRNEEKKMFINYTNHPSDAWGEKQREEASKYGEILDIHFPDISPQGAGCCRSGPAPCAR